MATSENAPQNEIAEQTTLMNRLKVAADPGLDAVKAKLSELKRNLDMTIH